MPELGQSRSPGGHLALLRGPGPAWVMGAQWGLQGGCNACSGSHPAPEGGRSFGALWAQPHHYRWHPPTPGTEHPQGRTSTGREGTMDSIPSALSRGWPACFQAAPAVPGAGGAISGALLLQRGPPGMANAPQPGRAARQSCSPAGWGLAGLFAFGTTPRRSSAPHKYLYS